MVINDQKQFFKDLYESIETNCSEDQLKNFANLGTDEERFKFVHNLSGVERFDTLRDRPNGKCLSEAIELKKQGNAAFQTQNYVVALEKYTQSQLVTPTEIGEFYES